MTRGKTKRPGTRAGGGGTNITKKPRPPLPDDLPDAAEAALDDLLSSSHLRVEDDGDELKTQARSTSEVALEELIPIDSDDDNEDEEPFTRARSRRLPSRVAPLPSARPATARPATARPVASGGAPPMERTVHGMRGAGGPSGRPVPSGRSDLPLRAMDADLDDVVDSLAQDVAGSLARDGVNSLDDDGVNALDEGVELTTNRGPADVASRASGQLTTSLRSDGPPDRPSGSILTTNLPSQAPASRGAPDRTEPVDRFDEIEDDDDGDLDDIGLSELPARKRATQSAPHVMPRSDAPAAAPARTTHSGPHTLPRAQIGAGAAAGRTTQSGPHTLPRAPEARSQQSAPHAMPRKPAPDHLEEPATRAAPAKRAEPAPREPVHRNTAPILDDNMFDEGSLGDGSLEDVDLDGPEADRSPRELSSLTFVVYEDSAHLAAAHTAITEAGHRVAVAAAGRDGVSRVVSAIQNGGIDVVLVTGRGGQPVIDAALAVEPRRPVIIAVGDGSTVEAVGRAAAADADLATVRPHSAERLAPLAFAAARIDAERRVAASAKGAEQVLRQRLEDLADAEPGGLLPFEMFQRVLELEIKRAKRFEYPLSVALFAVEIAPPPPPAGIRGILRARAGNALINTIRDIDIATQLDHERFLVLLPYTDLKGAASVGKRVIAAVSAGDPVISTGRSFPPRVVGAVAGMRKGEPVSFAKLMKDATRALEQARRDGAELAVQP